LYIVYTTFALLSVHYGTGRHLSDVPPVDRPVAFMWRHFSTIVYIVVSTLTKFVVGIFLLRLCSHIRWMKIMIWVMLVVVGVFNTFYFFIDIFSAQPVQYYWLRYAPNPPEGRVNDAQWATIPTYVASLLNVIVDWALAILPMILLWNAKIDRRTKISVCGVLAIGSMYVLPPVAHYRRQETSSSLSSMPPLYVFDLYFSERTANQISILQSLGRDNRALLLRRPAPREYGLPLQLH
jgi:hypothetical protein